MPRHQARKRFGQHFLTDPGVIDAILRSISVADSDIVVEVGPGLGAITTSLAATAGHLHAIELDRNLAASLRQRYEDVDNVTIHEADALDFDFSSIGDRFRVVGNLPYNISTPLLFHLLDHRRHILDMHFMLQKEVVDRMAAGPGSKAYGRLSIMLGCHLAVEKLFDVEPSAFDPPPAVMSAVVRLDPLASATFAIADNAHLQALVKKAFMARRKTVKNALQDMADSESLAAVNIDATLRPEQISIEKFVQLSNHLSASLR